MMEDQYRTEMTEKIKDEDWCANCERWVDRWVVFFEPGDEGGYDRIRRCPHCKAKCYRDSDSALGCFCFVVGFFGVPVLCSVVLSYLNPELKTLSERDLFWVVTMALGFLSGIFLSSIADRFEKKRRYRNRKIADHNRSLPPPPVKPDRH